jgi:hypothetical protein
MGGNAKSGRKGKIGRKPRFAAITKEILDSRAYMELPPSAAKALPYFLYKVGAKTLSALDDPERYRTDVTFTYKEAEALGFRRSTFSNILKNLTGHGFIDPAYKGWLRGSGHTSSRFRLSQRWQHYGTTAFKRVRWEEYRNVE